MKAYLADLLGWMENVYGSHPSGSAFEQELPPQALAQVEAALDLALTSNKTVKVLTGTIPARAVVSNLVFHRSRIQVEHIFNGNLGDDAFDTLATCLRQLKSSGLVFVEGTNQTLDGGETDAELVALGS